MEALVASNTARHETELAHLHGSRFASASETDAGLAWNEARLKRLTGGDKIAARFMNKDYFEFTPTFKLLVVGNHRPVIRTVDDAIRRRVCLVEFKNRPVAPDVMLKEKPREEWPRFCDG